MREILGTIVLSFMWVMSLFIMFKGCKNKQEDFITNGKTFIKISSLMTISFALSFFIS